MNLLIEKADSRATILALLVCVLISGCQSAPIFELKTSYTAGDELHVFSVNSDRVRQRCLFLNAEAENSWRHQYFMYVLSDKNEVFEIMQSTHQDEESCREQFDAIETLLRSEPQIKLCAHHRLKNVTQDPKAPIETVSFGRLGDRQILCESLTFDSVCSSKRCVGDNSAWVNTCPGFKKH